MSDITAQDNRSTYYWASWKRVATIAVPCGAVVFVACLTGGVQSLSKLMLYIGMSCVVGGFMFLIMGVTVIRIKNGELHYTNGPLVWTSTGTGNIQEIKVVPRFWFTGKATLVFLQYKEGGGIHGGILLSRDVFLDQTIAALVAHLKRLNPSITLDDGIQEILRSQGKLQE